MSKERVSKMLREMFDDLTGFRVGDAELGILSPGFDGGRAFTRRVEADGVHICDISYSGGGTKQSKRDEKPCFTEKYYCLETKRIVTVTFLDTTKENWVLMTFRLEKDDPADITQTRHGHTQKIAHFRNSYKKREFV